MKSILLLVLLTGFTATGFAQSKVSNFFITTEPTSAISIEPMMSEADQNAIIDSTNHKVTFVFILSGAENASKFKLKFGSSNGNWDLFSEDINADGSALPSNVTFIQEGNQIKITVGEYLNMSSYAASLQIEDADGSTSRVYAYQK